MPSELGRLPRWTFAHALLLEAERTGKSRDLKAAVRQWRQALSNEKWLDEAEEDTGLELLLSLDGRSYEVADDL